MTASGTRGDAGEAQPDQFLLEDLYPDAEVVFRPFQVKNIANSDCLVVLDTNVLLLPYEIKQDDLTAVGDVYSRLAEAKRLFIPGRVAREFLKNRDAQLADLIRALNEKRSKLTIPERRLSPLLDGLPGYNELLQANEHLAEARKGYLDRLGPVLDQLRTWRGDDPVTSLYNRVFSTESIVESETPRDELAAAWSVRLRNKTPPGYKDAGKADQGIGDFIIWDTILKLGRKHKSDLIFVTGDKKADWFVRSGGQGIFPRPELVDEYRRASGGKSLSLISFSDLLQSMNASQEIVAEVKSAEATPSPKLQKLSRANGQFESANIDDLLQEIFADRVQEHDESDLLELADEFINSGYTNLNEVRNDLARAMRALAAYESAEQHPGFFQAVGAVRTALAISNPRYRRAVYEFHDESKNYEKYLD